MKHIQLLTTQVHFKIPGIVRNTVGSYLIDGFTFVSDCVTVRVAVADCMALVFVHLKRNKKFFSFKYEKEFEGKILIC